MPYWVYQDQDVLSSEFKNIYQGNAWHYLCLTSQLRDAGTYVTTDVGNVPVIVTRGEDNEFYAFENRCAHRGALLTTERCGHTKCFTCVYHAWTHNLEGDLIGVTFKDGINGKGGMPKDFEMNKHSPRKMEVVEYQGLLFGTFSENAPTFREFVGARILGHIDRVIKSRTIEVLGQYTQTLPYNWKLYYENVKDTYHASILHLFFTTFGLNRLSQKGELVVNENGGCHVSLVRPLESEQAQSVYKDEGLRTESEYQLQAPQFVEKINEFDDDIQLQILSIFPGFVLQQIRNTIAIRQVVPINIGKTELRWTFIGFSDDSEELRERRLLQNNLVGPSGYVSMEDGFVGNIVQKGIRAAADFQSVIQMGGHEASSAPYRITEGGVRGMWKIYRNLMKI
ncbi:MAG: Rieske 2Fe-2S domain-containing protein [Comamonadaceae bacterium]|nr:Rieske 2Fe-2S domain-containing protein [Comamonadaceae bacterium]